MAESKQGQPQQQPLAIKEVRLDQSGRSANVISGRITGKAFRGNNPAAGVNLWLFVGGTQTPNSPLLTDDSGEATDDFSVAIGSDIVRVAIEARADSGIVGRRVVDFPSTTSSKSRPAVDKFAVNASGRNGKYGVSAVVSDKEGKPIEGVTVMFLYDGGAYSEITNAGGMATHKITFEQKGCDVTIQVAGIKPEVLRLLGSTRVNIPPCPAELKGFWNSIKIWKSIKAGIQAGLQAKQDADSRR